MSACPECQRTAPGHAINCRIGIKRATDYQQKLGARRNGQRGGRPKSNPERKPAK